MSHFDDLPRRDRNHEIEDKAIAAFQIRLTESSAFILQATDRKDYGTDCQIEVIADGRATNVRVHVQLKGTESALNAEGSFSVEVRRTNLNYLLMQPYSLYVAYHVPTGSLRIRTAESVARQYEHGETNWTDQRKLTVSFADELTVERLGQLADLAHADTKLLREWRADQVGVAAALLSRGEFPQSSNLEVNLEFSESDRSRFLSESFNFINDFFCHSLVALEKRHNRLKGEIDKIGSQSFSARIIKDGNSISQCVVSLVLVGVVGFGITTAEITYGDVGAYSEALIVTECSRKLFLSPSMNVQNGVHAMLSQLEAAEHFWSMLMAPIQR